MFLKALRLLAGVCVLLGFSATSASAGPITFEVTGVVASSVFNGTTNLLTTSTFSSLIGQPFTITATVDADVDDSFALGFNPTGLNTFQYFGDFSFVLGGYSGSRSGFLGDGITVQNDLPQMNGDLWDSIGGTFGGGTFTNFVLDPSFGTYSTASLSFGFQDRTGNALGSGDLPLALDLSDYQYKTMSLFLNPPTGGVHFIRANITSADVRAVPEPTGLLLFGSAAVAAAVRRYRVRN